MNDSMDLSPEEVAALYDILTHYETYAEIEEFKIPGTIFTYGAPFQEEGAPSTSPILQMLVSKFVLKLPGLRDVTADFWRLQVKDLIQDLSEADLSESYDKGLLGIRKTLATAISALLEYPARGYLTGLPQCHRGRLDHYDLSDPDHVLRSWEDCLEAIVHGDLVDDLVKRTAETDDLCQHDSLVQAFHEFIIVNLASLIHYTLVLSPEGPTLLRMIESVHRLIPYTMIRQTLKIGNVATMLNAMVKIFLAKMSVGSVTNWIGLSSGADEGMNLLQQIMSQVLNWDKRDFRHRAEKIEKSKEAPPKAVRQALRDWIQSQSRDEHVECRRMSQEQGMSIVSVILALSCGPTVDDLSAAQHANAMEWLSLQLEIRDRQEIVRLLCHRNPDHLTTAIYEAVNAYTPMIRQIHRAVNLSDTLWDFERFLTDMIKMSRPKRAAKNGAAPPSVEDYVDLLHRHQRSCHKFLHEIVKNGPEITSWWQEYVHMAASQFRRHEGSETEVGDPNTVCNKGLQVAMQSSLDQLSEAERETIRREVSTYGQYLNDLHAASAARIKSIIARTHSTPYGPGGYLARWQDLLDSTIITPKLVSGPVRKGRDLSVRNESRKIVGTDGADGESNDDADTAIVQSALKPPGCETTIRLLGFRFREIWSGL